MAEARTEKDSSAIGPNTTEGVQLTIRVGRLLPMAGRYIRPVSQAFGRIAACNTARLKCRGIQFCRSNCRGFCLTRRSPDDVNHCINRQTEALLEISDRWTVLAPIRSATGAFGRRGIGY